MLPLLYSVISICLVTAIPGAVFILFIHNSDVLAVQELPFVSLAIGSLLGDAIYHLIPESFGLDDGSFSIWTTSMLLVGILLFTFGEQKLQQHHSGHGHTHLPPQLQDEEIPRAHSQHSPVLAHGNLPAHFGPLLISSDMVHGFVDGLAIGTSFRASPVVGLSTVIAVFFHEVPHLLGDYTILASTGFSRLQLICYSVAAVCSSLTGAGLVHLAGHFASLRLMASIERGLLAFAAGNFLYIALADLIPEVLYRRVPSGSQGYLHYLFIIVGAAVMLLLKLYVA